MLLEKNGSNLENTMSLSFAGWRINWRVSTPAKWGSQPESGLGGRGQTDRWWWEWRPPYPAPPAWSGCTLAPRQYHRALREPCGESLEITYTHKAVDPGEKSGWGTPSFPLNTLEDCCQPEMLTSRTVTLKIRGIFKNNCTHFHKWNHNYTTHLAVSVQLSFTPRWMSWEVRKQGCPPSKAKPGITILLRKL